MDRKTYWIILILSIIALVFSIVIETEKLSSEKNTFCSVLGGGCDTVQTSIYGRTLGIDNPIFGMIGFSIMIILSIIQIVSPKKIYLLLIKIGSFIAGITAIWFLIVQVFILRAYCVYCLFVDAISLALLIISIIYLIRNEKHKKTR